jgi:hypothetical protein
MGKRHDGKFKVWSLATTLAISFSENMGEYWQDKSLKINKKGLAISASTFAVHNTVAWYERPICPTSH